MSGTLLRRDAATAWRPFLIIGAVLAMYAGVVTSMFDPELGESLQMMMEAMPQMFAAFGMANPGSTLAAFLANYLYGFLYLALPLVLILLLNSRFMVRWIDRGSMAWLLAAPLPRRKLAATQAAALSAAVTLLCLWIAGLGLALAEGMFPGELEMERFFWMNLGLWALLQLLAAICFLAGCAVPDSRLATGAGGGLCVLFLLLDMLAGMDEAWEALRFFTPLTLYDPMALSEGTAHLWMVAALAGAALVLYGLGTAIFCRRDLSL